MACKHFESELDLGRPPYCKAGEDVGETKGLTNRSLVWVFGCAGNGRSFDVICPEARSRAQRERIKLREKTAND